MWVPNTLSNHDHSIQCHTQQGGYITLIYHNRKRKIITLKIFQLNMNQILLICKNITALLIWSEFRFQVLRPGDLLLSKLTSCIVLGTEFHQAMLISSSVTCHWNRTSLNWSPQVIKYVSYSFQSCSKPEWQKYVNFLTFALISFCICLASLLAIEFSYVFSGLKSALSSHCLCIM